MSISPDGKARPEKVSAAFLHGCASPGPGVMAGETTGASGHSSGDCSKAARKQEESNSKNRRCCHLNKRINLLVTRSQSICACEPAMPTFLGIPVDRAPFQPMPQAWEEGKEGKENTHPGITPVQLEAKKPPGKQAVTYMSDTAFANCCT